MPDVPVVPVDVVDVLLVVDDRMAAAILVHVHVSRVCDMHDVDGLFVDVVTVDEVDVAVVQEVHMIVVRNGRVPAEAVVDMWVLVEGMMRGGVGHRYLRLSR